ncbi:MAG: hypothetical protein LIP04_12890 [Tannerellaceae bacterium]|nr:hypothetical protein [Tannerellaceae bacterium]
MDSYREAPEEISYIFLFSRFTIEGGLGLFKEITLPVYAERNAFLFSCVIKQVDPECKQAMGFTCIGDFRE